MVELTENKIKKLRESRNSEKANQKKLLDEGNFDKLKKEFVNRGLYRGIYKKLLQSGIIK